MKTAELSQLELSIAPRLYPVSEDTQFFLDNAAEGDDLPWPVVDMLYIFGDNIAMDKIINTYKPPIPLKVTLDKFIDYFVDLMTKDANIASLYVGELMRDLESRINLLSHDARRTHFEKVMRIRDRHGLGKVRFKKDKLDKNGGLSKQVRRRMARRRDIRRYVNDMLSDRSDKPKCYWSDVMGKTVASTVHVLDRLEAAGVSLDLAFFVEHSGVVRNLRVIQCAMNNTFQKFTRSIAYTRHYREFRVTYGAKLHKLLNATSDMQMNMLDDYQTWLTISNQVRDTLPVGKRPTKAAIKQARKVLRKSLDLAKSICGDDARRFLGGEAVDLRGDKFVLRVKKRAHINGHGAVGVELWDVDGDKLANVCIFVDSTPLMDQFTAFALYMASGLEDEIVRVGNLTALTDKAKTYEVISEKHRHSSVSVAEILGDIRRDPCEPGKDTVLMERRKFQDLFDTVPDTHSDYVREVRRVLPSKLMDMCRPVRNLPDPLCNFAYDQMDHVDIIYKGRNLSQHGIVKDHLANLDRIRQMAYDTVNNEVEVIGDDLMDGEMIADAYRAGQPADLSLLAGVRL